MIRVLVADDSPTARALLVGIFASDPAFSVVGEAASGDDAVEMAESLAPDLVTMDIHMPGIDGLEATKQIMMRSPRPIIIVSSTVRTDEIEQSLEATRAGALIALPKPEGPSSASFDADRRSLLSMARAMSGVKVVRRHGAGIRSVRTPAEGVPSTRRSGSAPVDHTVRVVAIGASTGGPAALRDILAQLPRSFPVPIFIVQHIARGFTAGLAHWLDADTSLRVKVAELGEAAVPGRVYVAAEDRQLGCRVDAAGAIRIALDLAPPIGAFRPSASYLFQSCAEAVGAGVLAVILTGMGDDGVSGLRVVCQRGGRVIAQDETSSVIYGMPREAVRAGVVDSIVGLEGIPRRLLELTS